MARHRHIVNVRTDGLRAVLGPLLRDRRVRSAVLVDVDSGMLLDGCSADLELPELEVLGAGHADLVRTALAGADGSGPACELVLTRGDGQHTVLRTVPDPHGDRLALAVVVSGGRLAVERARRRLGVVSAPALTAGPSMTRRPDAAGWSLPVGPVPVAAGPAAPAPTTAPAAPAPRPGSGPGAGAGPDGARVDGSRADASRADASRADSRRADGPRADGGRVDAALLTLGGFARPAPEPGALRPGPPVLRAVPPPAPGALFVSTVPSPPARPPVPPAPRSPLGPPAARPAPQPTPQPRPSSARPSPAPVISSVEADADRPPAPLSALAPGPRREEPAGER
jgi:hypothetical protein